MAPGIPGDSGAETNMALTFPVIVCLIGAAGNLSVALRMRNFKVKEQPPKSLAHLSREERQHRIAIGSWIAFTLAIFLTVAAAFLAWLSR